jgi:ABC-2 type transport system ATP-binding protein
LASHLLDEVEKVCSHVLVLRKGVIYILVQLMACQQMRDSSNYKRMTQKDDRSFKNTAVESIKQEEGKVLFI